LEGIGPRFGGINGKVIYWQEVSKEKKKDFWTKGKQGLFNTTPTSLPAHPCYHAPGWEQIPFFQPSPSPREVGYLVFCGKNF